MLRSRSPITALIATGLVLSLSGCSEGPHTDEVVDNLPAEWGATTGSDDESERITVRLEPGGEAMLQNVPYWDGTGDCLDERPRVYSGTASWRLGHFFDIDIPDGGSVVLAPTLERFGKPNWAEVAVAVCGADSPLSRLEFLYGGGPDGELMDPRDGSAGPAGPAESSTGRTD